MALLAAVCHGAKPYRYDYSRFNHLTADNITSLERQRTALYKNVFTPADSNKMETCVWNMAKYYDSCNRMSNAMNTTNYKFVKCRTVVEIPKSK